MDKAWSGRTGGSKWEQRSLIRIFRYLNPIWLYPLMEIWIIGYICFGRSQRRAIWYYHRQRLHQTYWQACIGLLRNYNEFGKAILDRFACWSGRKMNIIIDGQDLWEQKLMGKQPFVIIGAHVGNLEIAGYTIRMPKKVFTLVYMGETETVETNRKSMFEQMGLTIIPVQKDGGHILDMHCAIAQGHVVTIHGDRTFFYTRALRARLLGAEAQLPEGCFRFAVAEKVAVLSLYIMREKAGQYRAIVRQLSDGQYRHTSRSEQVNELVTAYTQTMESILQQYPNQWFNFFEFWS